MTTIDVAQLRAMRENGEAFTLVNTLAEEHFEKTRIPQSINIPQSTEDFAAQVEEAAGGKNHTVVVYCASSECNSSEKAAQKLESAGFAQVLVFKGGAKAWHEEEATAAAR
jgi:rhodanese-related sulfurtransferase